MSLDALQLLLYIAALIGLMVLSRRLFQFFGDLELPQYLSTALFCTALVYLSALVPGIFGFLTITNSYILFILLVISALYWMRVTPVSQIQSRASLSTQSTSLTFSLLDWGLMIIGAILCAPLFAYLKGLPLAFADPNPVLGWDVVSYHLPGVIEFYQNKTLWSLSGPYQSYSFGYELIGNYFSQGFYTSWGLIIANLLALSLVVSAIVSVIKTLSLSDLAGKTSWLASSILAIGLWTILAINSLSAVGKNDVFKGATVLAALAFLLILCANTFTSTLKRNLLILLIGLGLGLSMASKPSAIAYLPYFWAATILGLLQQKKDLRGALYIASAVIAVALLVGGFWLARNLIFFGRLSPVLDSGWQVSILANVLNKEMYRAAIYYPAFMLATTAWIPAFLIALRHPKDSYGRLAWILIGSFHLTACLVFVITPFAYQGGGFETRLGMPLLISAAIIYGVVIPLAIQRLFALRYSRLALGALIIILMLAIPYYWSTKKQANLFGYEEVFASPKIEPLPKTSVYTWAQNLKEPLRIYSAGLRPYGLYGRHWGNTLFYDLHSSTLVDGPDGKKRIAAVVDQFGPDLILISLAPHANSPLGIQPEVLTWMQERVDLFTEVYSDDIVRGYRVKPGAKEILTKEFPEPYVLKMGE
jgi:4-amino-4-deoxy-L-arabinose transferase-like glycosyltransferase